MMRRFSVSARLIAALLLASALPVSAQVVVSPGYTTRPYLNLFQPEQTTNAQPALNVTTTWNNAAVVFTGIKFVITDTASAAGSTGFLLQRTGLGATSKAGLTLENPTAAAAGAQQYSPGLSQIAQGWSTGAGGASMPVETRWELRPVQGAAAPTFNYVLMGRVNNGSWSDIATFSSGGAIAATSNVSAAAGSLFYWSGRTWMASPADGVLSLTTSSAVPTGFVSLLYGPAGAATTSNRLQKKVTAIADATATTVLTVTVPNGDHAALIDLKFLSSNGGADAFESSRESHGMVVIQRNAGKSAVATAAALDDAAIATNATGGSATHTFAYSVVANAEGAAGTETVSIKVTIDDSGNLGGNQVFVVAELMNAEATGITIQ